jgi:hypothetical protein
MMDRDVMHSIARDNSDHRKSIEKERHDLGVNQVNYTPGQLVMLYDHKSAKKKLHPAYRGPFRIALFARDHKHTFHLQQLDQSPIPRSYSGDHFKLFQPRSGHLISQFEEALPVYQNIRASKGTHRLPRTQQ